ncbi:MAG: hypothetical protein MSE70_09395 [Streptococcus sp.]|uniref:RNase H family protein n=1 Tax=Streptococcus TaxID=1301 RepID=UPI001F07096A|nr:MULTISPECIES: RNase H family protein [Streptococcus]MCH1619028.1 hypothetical protein [Streptococcus gallolyticus]MCI7517233.1 hypothetical protein [Streptococcus sp.]MDV5123937.1 RNase H family protein [Streptococcus pasteurianus]MDV5135614.1 RNase H family protein [Streptococcus pasteurianus]MDV5151869.1 RNase H family protein [Streptococcus pasteurianus]
MDSETHHSGNYIIYTDGSYKKYNIPNTKEKLLNSTGAELFSVIIALKALRKISKDADRVTVKIMTDYQELKRFHKMLNYHGKSHYKKQKFKEKRQTFQWNWYYSNPCQVFRLYKELGKELTLEIEWCQGHAGIFWNEQANILARKLIKKSESK